MCVWFTYLNFIVYLLAYAFDLCELLASPVIIHQCDKLGWRA